MAIQQRKRKGGKISYRVRIKDSAGNWITKTFHTRKEASLFESQVKIKLSQNFGSTIQNSKLTLNQYWDEWVLKSRDKTSEGWKLSQNQMYRDYIQPFIGECQLRNISPIIILEILNSAKVKGRSNQTQLHIFNLLNKLFSDAIDRFEYIYKNPVKKSFKPQLIKKEAKSLTMHEIRKLIKYVQDKEYGLPVLIQLFCGLRAGEVQVLRWRDINLMEGVIHIRGTYSRKTKTIQSYPKGRKWHNVYIPPDLKCLLSKKMASSKSSETDFVFKTQQHEFLSYHCYYKALKSYCRNIGIETTVSTHTLRHSTATIYIQHGASRDDIQHLFAHSTASVTSRYIHDEAIRGKNLKSISSSLKLYVTNDSFVDHN